MSARERETKCEVLSTKCEVLSDEAAGKRYEALWLENTVGKQLASPGFKQPPAKCGRVRPYPTLAQLDGGRDD